MAVIAVMLVAGFLAVADGCGCCGDVVGRAVLVMIMAVAALVTSACKGYTTKQFTDVVGVGDWLRLLA